MTNWALDDPAGRVTGVGADTTVSRGPAVTSGSAHNKGSYVELSSSTPRASHIVVTAFAATSVVDFLVDIALGTGGSETVIVSNLLVSAGGSSGEDTMLYYPMAVPIPAGSRLAARCQSSTSSAAVYVVVLFMHNGLPAGAMRLSTYGAETGDTSAISVTTSASANTYGSFTEISASTSAPIHRLLIVTGSQRKGLTSSAYRFELAIGAGGSEQVIAEFFMASHVTPDTLRPAFFGPLDVNIPAGSRLTVRLLKSAAGAESLDFALYGMD